MRLVGLGPEAVRSDAEHVDDRCFLAKHSRRADLEQLTDPANSQSGEILDRLAVKDLMLTDACPVDAEEADGDALLQLHIPRKQRCCVQHPKHFLLLHEALDQIFPRVFPCLAAHSLQMLLHTPRAVEKRVIPNDCGCEVLNLTNLSEIDKVHGAHHHVLDIFHPLLESDSCRHASSRVYHSELPCKILAELHNR
jgi:hypothetical protein